MSLSGAIAHRRASTSTRRAGRRTRPSSRSWPSARAARSTTAGSRSRDVDGLLRRRHVDGRDGHRRRSPSTSNLKPRYLDGTNIGGSSFVAHVAHAAAAIHAGLCEVALILYGSTAASNALRDRHRAWAAARDPAAAFVAPYGLTTVGSYALVAQRHMQRYGTTLRAARRDRRRPCAATPALNPHAKMREPITRRRRARRAA